jgi:hypothetical protein
MAMQVARAAPAHAPDISGEDDVDCGQDFVEVQVRQGQWWIWLPPA